VHFVGLYCMITLLQIATIWCTEFWKQNWTNWTDR